MTSFSEAFAVATRILSTNKDAQLIHGANQPEEPLTTGNHLVLTGRTDETLNAHQRRQVRGEADRAALTRRYHDANTHAKLGGNDPAGFVTDIELARIDILGARHCAGIRENLHQFLTLQTDSSSTQKLSISQALAVLMREHFGHIAPPSSTLGALLPWQQELAPALEQHQQQLIESLHDQQAFHRLVQDVLLPAIEGQAQDGNQQDSPESESLEEAAGNDDPQAEAEYEDQDTQEEQSGEQQQDGQDELMQSDEALTPDKQTDEILQQAEGEINHHNQPEDSSETAFTYRIYTNEFDEIIPASHLASPQELTRLRQELDQKMPQLQQVTRRLANRLQRLLLARVERYWQYELEEGLLNNARLPQAVIAPGFPYLYKQEVHSKQRETIVSLLIDNSGSMRGRPITIAALSADILAHTLERCGVKVEILGFTTREWRGGDARKQWQNSGKPLPPGRLNDLRHIIYKSAEQPVARTRRNLALMLKDGILKENIDGEALLWAHQRLLSRPEQRRILMVISDGAPVDDSTLSLNSGDYLDKHLRMVIHQIENRSDIELLAIGIGHDVSRYYRHALMIDDVDKLGEVMLGEVTKLFINAA